MQPLKYIEYNGQPVLSARELYAFLTDCKGDNVAAWIEYCAQYPLFVKEDDTFEVKTERGQKDILLVPTAAAIVCSSFKNENGRKVFEMLRELNSRNIDHGNSDADHGTTITINQAAKILNLGEGPNELFRILRSARIITRTNVPMANYVAGGFFKVIQSQYQKIDGSVYYYAKTMVTPKGIEFIKEILIKNRIVKEVAA
jgi:hypothetical protein